MAVTFYNSRIDGKDLSGNMLLSLWNYGSL